MKKRIIYGTANYEDFVRKNGYFVDKTAYLELLETVENPVFLRPRRFGKSLWCRILECYYSVSKTEDFETFFGHTYIGQHPTPLRNSYFVLSLDFSAVDPHGSIHEIEESFNIHCNHRLQVVVEQYSQWFQTKVQLEMKAKAIHNLTTLLTGIETNIIEKPECPRLYVIIDEYDNFANQLITTNRDHLYYDLTTSNSFLKPFFKILKEGRKTGAIANIFITGVLPITLDDLASGFNIASFITLNKRFENMLGFTQTEVDKLLTEIFQDYALPVNQQLEVRDLIRNYYNGYHFINPQGEAVYNSTSLVFFLDQLCQFGEIPPRLIDLNLKTDISWVRRLTSSNPSHTQDFVEQLLLDNEISFDEMQLAEKFNISQFLEKSFYPASFFYLGLLTRCSDFTLCLPNAQMRQIFTEYFNEIHCIDVSSKYDKMMQHFVTQLDLPRLFADYWELYISQLPEAIFSKVNENFYRTTFFELCSRFLSKWFTWNLERSYPQGKSDLEFVGKSQEKFAGVRMVIEFKYYSNHEFKKLKTPLAELPLQATDLQQLQGYVAGLRQEYPNAHISQFVIYCIGNQGFRVFEAA